MGPRHGVRDDGGGFVDQDPKFLGSFSVHDCNKSFEFRTCTRRITIVLDETDVPGIYIGLSSDIQFSQMVGIFDEKCTPSDVVTHDSTAGPLSLTQCRLPSL